MANIFSSSNIIIQNTILTTDIVDGVNKTTGRLNHTKTEIIQRPPSKTQTNINVLFEAINKELAKIDIENVVVEKTLDNSILLKSDLHKMRFYLELFLIDEEPFLEYDIVINIYINQKHIFGTAGSVKKTFAEVKQFLK